MIRVFNYHNKEKVVSLEAHSDYVRAISVHPTHPYILSSSDDYTIRMFDWENNWKVRQVFFTKDIYTSSTLLYILIKPQIGGKVMKIDYFFKIFNMFKMTSLNIILFLSRYLPLLFLTLWLQVIIKSSVNFVPYNLTNISFTLLLADKFTYYFI
jgi:WD40 repeat protein